ncbi:hypothetical protein PROFUN_11309 [Planoprotostelium fungivorum]|uniref:DNA-(apurinic or apyrimidinic site) lyase n=1 Tax=Planoprotostelium fungivorum TaxID=1890364 RepID=A0A2P6N2J6_9EUKA|nr:hypothetical protein PROFUN_11309 [Planoprotostelium fungivorum]
MSASKTMVSSNGWKPLGLSSSVDLNLSKTLRCGQSFRWRKLNDSEGESWVGVIGRRVYGLREDGTGDVCYRVLARQDEKEEGDEERLRNYLHLDRDLVQLYDRWSAADERFRGTGERYGGLRLLRQDPAECLFSFICTSNNNIARITKMIESLCAEYGEKIYTSGDTTFHTFPTIEQLAAAEEEKFRDLGFGYRARFVTSAAKQVIERGGETWLNGLTSETMSREKVRSELMQLMGVGRKVADCVALFSLNRYDIVPVDTHVWQIAQSYWPKLKGKTLTPSLHDEVNNLFCDKFGDYAGWAHSVLFASDLAFFQKEELLLKKRESGEMEKVKVERVRLEGVKLEKVKTETTTVIEEVDLSERSMRRMRREKVKYESAPSRVSI